MELRSLISAKNIVASLLVVGAAAFAKNLFDQRVLEAELRETRAVASEAKAKSSQALAEGSTFRSSTQTQNGQLSELEHRVAVVEQGPLSWRRVISIRQSTLRRSTSS